MWSGSSDVLFGHDACFNHKLNNGDEGISPLPATVGMQETQEKRGEARNHAETDCRGIHRLANDRLPRAEKGMNDGCKPIR